MLCCCPSDEMKILRLICVVLCFAIGITSGDDSIKERHEKEAYFLQGRVMRSADGCNDQSNTTYKMNATSLPTMVLCSCGNVGDMVTWSDANCNVLTSLSLSDDVTKNGYAIAPPTLEQASVVYYCSSGDCVQKVIVVLTTTDDVTATGMSSGVRGFLIFLIITLVLVGTLVVVTRFKRQVYLGFRDSCVPTSGNDGMDFDAYVSIGKNESDRKFLERNVLDVLKQEQKYKFIVDDENLLPKLDYSDRVQDKLHRSHLLIIMFTATYMTNDWCMYCFTEGLRKLLELNRPMLFLVCDLTIQRELNSVSSLIGHVPKIYLPLVQTDKEKQKILRQIRMHLPAPHKRGQKRTMRSPILSDVEDIDQHSLRADGENYGGTETKYTFKKDDTDDHVIPMDEIDHPNEDEYVFDEGEDPQSIQIKAYKARPDFYTITSGVDDA